MILFEFSLATFLNLASISFIKSDLMTRPINKRVRQCYDREKMIVKTPHTMVINRDESLKCVTRLDKSMHKFVDIETA